MVMNLRHCNAYLLWLPNKMPVSPNFDVFNRPCLYIVLALEFSLVDSPIKSPWEARLGQASTPRTPVVALDAAAAWQRSQSRPASDSNTPKSVFVAHKTCILVELTTQDRSIMVNRLSYVQLRNSGLYHCTMCSLQRGIIAFIHILRLRGCVGLCNVMK